MSDFFLGLDLGQRADYTALSAIERIVRETGQTRTVTVQGESRFTDGLGFTLKRPAMTAQEIAETESVYEVRHLERFPIGTPYPEIVARVVDLQSRGPLKDAPCVTDATGVGAPVMDMLRAARAYCVGVTITGGDSVSQANGEYRVPKRDLASVCIVMLQAGRLQIANRLPGGIGPLLKKELAAFRVKINLATGHDSYEAWRESDHDDLVLSVALPLWYAEYLPPVTLSC